MDELRNRASTESYSGLASPFWKVREATQSSLRFYNIMAENYDDGRHGRDQEYFAPRRSGLGDCLLQDSYEPQR
jgi:hypothetical protein